MGKTSWEAKTKKKVKFSTRRRSRCRQCGRPRSFIKKFGLCRICFRTLAHQGVLPGVTKSSW